jgi:hypothetical protein
VSDEAQTETAYREGHEYVLCPECGSHILLDGRAEYLDHDFDEDPETSRTESFGCDNDTCGASFCAVVHPPEPGPVWEPKPVTHEWTTVFFGEKADGLRTCGWTVADYWTRVPGHFAGGYRPASRAIYESQIRPRGSR